MKDFSAIIKRLLFGKTPQTWICIPEFMDAEEKKLFIKNTTEFLKNNILIKEKN